MSKFYSHLWTRYKSRKIQHCKRCGRLMDIHNMNSNCMSPKEKECAIASLGWRPTYDEIQSRVEYNRRKVTKP